MHVVWQCVIQTRRASTSRLPRQAPLECTPGVTLGTVGGYADVHMHAIEQARLQVCTAAVLQLDMAPQPQSADMTTMSSNHACSTTKLGDMPGWLGHRATGCQGSHNAARSSDVFWMTMEHDTRDVSGHDTGHNPVWRS